jgi:hypothetical protein
MVLTTGVMGGFTTSSFNYETMRLLRGRRRRPGSFTSSTLASCLLAGVAGLLLARLVAGVSIPRSSSSLITSGDARSSSRRPSRDR